MAEGVKGAAKGNVAANLAETGHIDKLIERVDKGGHVEKGYGGDTAVLSLWRGRLRDRQACPF